MGNDKLITVISEAFTEQKITEMRLTRNGATVDIAESVEEALEKLKAYHCLTVMLYSGAYKAGWLLIKEGAIIDWPSTSEWINSLLLE